MVGVKFVQSNVKKPMEYKTFDNINDVFNYMNKHGYSRLLFLDGNKFYNKEMNSCAYIVFDDGSKLNY